METTGKLVKSATSFERLVMTGLDQVPSKDQVKTGGIEGTRKVFLDTAEKMLTELWNGRVGITGHDIYRVVEDFVKFVNAVWGPRIGGKATLSGITSDAYLPIQDLADDVYEDEGPFDTEEINATLETGWNKLSGLVGTVKIWEEAKMSRIIKAFVAFLYVAMMYNKAKEGKTESTMGTGTFIEEIEILGGLKESASGDIKGSTQDLMSSFSRGLKFSGSANVLSILLGDPGNPKIEDLKDDVERLKKEMVADFADLKSLGPDEWTGNESVVHKFVYVLGGYLGAFTSYTKLVKERDRAAREERMNRERGMSVRGE